MSHIEVSTEILEKLKEVARREGRELQALVDEALEDLLEKYAGSRPQPQFMQAYRENAVRFAPLLKRLAE